MTSATVRCRKCLSIVQGDLCDICGEAPMIRTPRVPAAPAKTETEAEPKEAWQRELARRRDATTTFIEQYRREHPGASAHEAALEALKAQRRETSAKP